MWISTAGYGMTDEVTAQVRMAKPDASPVREGDCESWLNVDTGARVLHVAFGSFGMAKRSHGVFYRSPNGELFDIAHPVAELYEYEMELLPEVGDDRYRNGNINSYWWRKVEHAIQRMLGFRDDEFTLEFPKQT